MNTQQAEIDVLKSQVKTLKRMFYGFGCLVIAGIALAATSMQGVPDVIEAKVFRVVNDEGKVMAGLTSDADGGRLDIFKDEKSVVQLGAYPDGGMLAIFNKDEKVVAGLGATSDAGRLEINNEDGKLVARIIATSDGGGRLDIGNKDEKIGAGLGAGSDGGLLHLHDKEGKLVFLKP